MAPKSPQFPMYDPDDVLYCTRRDAHNALHTLGLYYVSKTFRDGYDVKIIASHAGVDFFDCGNGLIMMDCSRDTLSPRAVINIR